MQMKEIFLRIDPAIYFLQDEVLATDYKPESPIIKCLSTHGDEIKGEFSYGETVSNGDFVEIGFKKAVMIETNSELFNLVLN
jgi:hypothetical protein